MFSRKVERQAERGIGMPDPGWHHELADTRGAEDATSRAPEGAADRLSALLHALWHAAWLASGRPVATSLRPAAHELARAARDAGMAPEQFVAAVKASWRADPRVRGATDQVEIRERLAVVVTVCIQEFYEE